MNLRRVSTTKIVTYFRVLLLIAAALHRWRSNRSRQLKQHDEQIKVAQVKTLLLVKPVEPHKEEMKHYVDINAKRRAANNNKTVHAVNPNVRPKPDVNKAKDNRKVDDRSRIQDNRKPSQ